MQKADSLLEFLEEMIPYLKLEIKKERTRCSPETPGITILFGTAGELIVKNYWKIPDPRIIFDRLELALNAESRDLDAAIYTGLIEAMIHEADITPGIWERLYPLLGVKSAKHAKEWMDFSSQ